MVISSTSSWIGPRDLHRREVATHHTTNGYRGGNTPMPCSRESIALSWTGMDTPCASQPEGPRLVNMVVLNLMDLRMETPWISGVASH